MTDAQWLSWITRGQTVATLLVAIGVAGEFVGDWAKRPIERRIEDAREVEIAQLKHNSEAVSRDTAQANERASALELGSDKLKLEISGANERAAKLELETVSQRERAAKAEAALLELQEKVKPRHLTADQRDKLTAQLRARPKGHAEIMCPSNDAEACVFGEELQSVLNDSGWTTDISQGVLVRVPTGLQISQRREGDALPFVQALYAVFRAFGIDASVVFDPDIPENHARVLVGRKP